LSEQPVIANAIKLDIIRDKALFFILIPCDIKLLYTYILNKQIQIVYIFL